jgi:c-di-GMP-binding flagellar brake protein YcgR
MDTDQITGKDILHLFETLKQDKTLIKCRLIGKNYENLTMIADIRRKFRKAVVVFDPPEGFQEALAGARSAKVAFEFTGRDGIQYEFRTTAWELHPDQLQVESPPAVQRHQRRKYFRLEAPDGTVAEFQFRNARCCEKVVDVSLGGALIALVCFGSVDSADFPFKVGDILEDIELQFPAEAAEETIFINKASVVRFEAGRYAARTCCGLEFLEIDEDQLKTLTDFIYRFQRRYLRNRLKPDL